MSEQYQSQANEGGSDDEVKRISSSKFSAKPSLIQPNNRLSCPPSMGDAKLVENYFHNQDRLENVSPKHTISGHSQSVRNVANMRYSQNVTSMISNPKSPIRSLFDSTSMTESNYPNCPDVMSIMVPIVDETEGSTIMNNPTNETNPPYENVVNTTVHPLDETPSATWIPTVPNENSQEKTEKSSLPVFILFLNGFVFFMNYMIVFPTAQRYVQSLNGGPTAAGITLGVTCFVGVLMQYPGHKWASRSFKEPLVFSAIIMIIGNLIYALGDTLECLALVVVARGVMGINLMMTVVSTRYIAETTTREERTRLMAILYIVGTAGIAVGPFLAGILAKIPNFKVGPFLADQYVNPAWFCFILWIAQLIFVVLVFRDPVSKRSRPSLYKLFYIRWPLKSCQCPAKNLSFLKRHATKRASVLTDGLKTMDSEKADVISTIEKGSIEEIPPPGVSNALPIGTWHFSAILFTLFAIFGASTMMAILEATISAIGVFHFRLQEDVVGFLLGGVASFAVLTNFALTALMQWRKLSDRFLLVTCHVIDFCGLLVLFSYRGDSYPLAQFIVGSCLLFAGGQYLRCIQYSILTKVSPVHFKYKTKEGSLTSSLLAAAVVNILGRGVGPLLGAQAELWDMNIIFAIILILMIIILVGSLVYWKLIRNPMYDSMS